MTRAQCITKERKSTQVFQKTFRKRSLYRLIPLVEIGESLIDTLNRFWKEDGYMFALTELIASNIDSDLPVMKCDSKDKKHRMVQKNE